MCSYYKSPLTQYNMPVRSILAGQAPCAGQMLLSLRPHSSSNHKSTFQHPKETATAVTNYIQNTLERRSCSLVLLLCRLRSYYHNMALYRNHRKKIIPKCFDRERVPFFVLMGSDPVLGSCTELYYRCLPGTFWTFQCLQNYIGSPISSDNCLTSFMLLH